MFNDKDTEHKIKFLIKGEGVTIEPFGLFTMDTVTGDVFIHRAVDREVKHVYHVSLQTTPTAKRLGYGCNFSSLMEGTGRFFQRNGV